MSKTFFKAVGNYVSTMGALVLAYGFYFGSGRFAHLFEGTHSFPSLGLAFTTGEAMTAIFWTYAALLPFYYAFEKDESSASRFVRGIWQRRFDEGWKKSGREIALKAFFVPLMVGWMFSHASFAFNGTEQYFFSGGWNWNLLTDVAFFSYLFQTVLFVDVFFFTAGYLIESSKLGNRIVSVDPTASGWLVCLLCYPPFNSATNSFLGWYSSDSPVLQNSPAVTLVLNVLIVALMAIYASASAAL